MSGSRSAPSSKRRGEKDKKIGVMVYETMPTRGEKLLRGAKVVRSMAMPKKAVREILGLRDRGQAGPVVIERRERDFVILPRAKYEALIDRLEDLEDAADIREAEERGVTEDALPAELVDRLIEGEHPLRIWREHRGLTLAQLAERSGVGLSYISEIEHGQKPGSAQALKALAHALGVETDDLIR